MTVASINSTVTVIVSSELGMGAASSYAEAIAKVSEALEAREYDIVDAIVDAASDQFGSYVNGSEVRAILVGAGLAQRPAPAPVVVPEPEVKEDETVTADDVASGKLSKGERIAKLEESQAATLSTLTKLVDAVGELTKLANRHLGASL